jgi:hypothetical protein
MKTGITIEMEGGLITAIWATHTDMEIEVIDHDTEKDEDVPEDELAEYHLKVALLEQQTKSGERVSVY